MLEDLKSRAWAVYNKLFGAPSDRRIAEAIKAVLANSRTTETRKPGPGLRPAQLCTIIYPGVEQTVCAPDIHDSTNCDLLRRRLGQGGACHMLDECPDGSRVVHGR